MWHDIEAKVDLLNFSFVAEVADSRFGRSPADHQCFRWLGRWEIISGQDGWKGLGGEKGADKKYLFLKFNAWLYQGFDGARQALLQSVSTDTWRLPVPARRLCKRCWTFGTESSGGG